MNQMAISYQATSNQALHPHKEQRSLRENGEEKKRTKGKDIPKTYGNKTTRHGKHRQLHTNKKNILQRNTHLPMHKRKTLYILVLPVMLGSRLRPLWSLQWTNAASKSHWPNRLRMLLTFGRAGAGKGRVSQLLWLGLDSRVGEDEVCCCCCCCCCWDALVGWLLLPCRVEGDIRLGYWQKDWGKQRRKKILKLKKVPNSKLKSINKAANTYLLCK